MVKMSGVNDNVYTLTALAEKPDLAKKVKAALEKEGFKVTETPSTKKNQVLDGYRVLIDAPGVVKPYYETLKHERAPVRISKDGKELQLGTTFKNKRLAQTAASKYAKYGFQVRDNFRDVEVKATRLELKGLDKEQADKAESIFDENKQPVDREATPKSS